MNTDNFDTANQDSYPHQDKRKTRTQLVALAVVICLFAATAFAQLPAPSQPVPLPMELKQVPVPEPIALRVFVHDRQAAIMLGKALYWDMQIGSDGVTSCASCHFHAGADNRTKNTLAPGRPPTPQTFHTKAGPNAVLAATNFPFRLLSNPDDRHSPVVRDSDDIVGSQGVLLHNLTRVLFGLPRERATATADPVFQVGGVNTRRVTARNTPSVINAAFNASQFRDGRANFFFNGEDPFGPLNVNAVVFVFADGLMSPQHILLDNASLASQAVGPPHDTTEMSFVGRNWPQIGRKVLNLRPLGKQLVHPQDSVLGPFSRARLNGRQVVGLPGISIGYSELIRNAFHPEYWGTVDKVVRVNADGTKTVIPRPTGALATNEFTHMEINFAFLFGLAVQMYESTLIADDTRFDRFLEGDGAALTAQEQSGMDIFFDKGKCAICHGGSEMTEAAVRAVEFMPAADPDGKGRAFYDAGFFNIGVRPTAEDLGAGATAPFINPRTGQPYPLSLTDLGVLKKQGLLPLDVDPFIPALPFGITAPTLNRSVMPGAFKAPGLRNVELTGPYQHNGGYATLRQVVDFYDRGGDFRDQNIDNMDPFIGLLELTEQEKQDLVSFLMALTDERVRQEKAPFDHPQLFVPNGQRGDENGIVGPNDQLNALGFRADEEVMEIPPVGAPGRASAGLPPVGRFLNLNPQQP
ncbi:MAG: cytochrome C peroxidase [Verrucomicrobia bacterium]|nr:cytochrome C peroxidase [Verrucomicrobiota bacterium]